MREIKFRAWDKTEQKMHEWDYLIGYCDLDWLFGDHASFRPDIEVMQYTGLHDANGVEIYEGDIVKEGDLIAVVEYHTEDVGSCGCCYTEFDGAGFAAFGRDKSNRVTGMSLGEDCEVIGNVHQNPELVNT